MFIFPIRQMSEQLIMFVNMPWQWCSWKLTNTMATWTWVHANLMTAYGNLVVLNSSELEFTLPVISWLGHYTSWRAGCCKFECWSAQPCFLFLSFKQLDASVWAMHFSCSWAAVLACIALLCKHIITTCILTARICDAECCKHQGVFISASNNLCLWRSFCASSH